MEFLIDFLNLGANKIYSINNINLWLTKYSEQYLKNNNLIQDKFKTKTKDETLLRFPPFWKSNDNEKFINLYQELTLISLIHKDEIIIENVFSEFYNSKSREIELKKLFQTNQDLANKKYDDFFIPYMLHEEQTYDDYPMIYIHTMDELQIFIEKNDFKNTLNFINIYNDINFF